MSIRYCPRTRRHLPNPNPCTVTVKVGCTCTPHQQPHAHDSPAEWLPSGSFTALLGLIWYELKASEARLNKRTDELREDQKELREKVDALPWKIME